MIMIGRMVVPHYKNGVLKDQ